MLSLQENQWKKLYLRMTVLDTKYKAEMNAVWTICVKYGLIIDDKWNLSLEKYVILKWKTCRKPVMLF